MNLNRNVLVIGARIVGTCCALYLQREGFIVTLMDRGGPGEGASLGNAGNLGIASCVPAAMPGLFKKILLMLLDPAAPLKLRWSHLPAALPWFVRFLRAASRRRAEEIADARQSLLGRLHEGCAPLLADASAEKLIAHSGLLMVWESDAVFEGARYAINLRRRRGVEFEILSGNEARNIEPALSSNVKHAVYVPRLAHVADPLRLTRTLAEHFTRRGGRILREQARGFEIGLDGPRRVIADMGGHEVDQVVLSAGVWSRPLAAELGTRVPLEAERGYHAMFPDPRINLRVAVMSADRYIAITHMEHSVRASGIAEFAPVDAAPNWNYVRRIREHAGAVLPGLNAAVGSQWMGPRPSHPDSKPVIGRSPRFRSVYFAFGHDHIGLALGGITGKLIGEIVAGRPPSIDLTPFRPDRF